MDKIERTTLIQAPRERVWRAITTPAEIGQWFQVEIHGIFQPGAVVKMTTTNDHHKGIQFSITVDRMEEGRLFSWRWHPGMPDAGIDYSKEPTTLVEFRLEDAPGGTLVTVTESGFDQISLERRARVFDENNKGWEVESQNLARYVVPTR